MAMLYRLLYALAVLSPVDPVPWLPSLGDNDVPAGWLMNRAVKDVDQAWWLAGPDEGYGNDYRAEVGWARHHFEPFAGPPLWLCDRLPPHEHCATAVMMNRERQHVLGARLLVVRPWDLDSFPELRELRVVGMTWELARQATNRTSWRSRREALRCLLDRLGPDLVLPLPVPPEDQ